MKPHFKDFTVMLKIKEISRLIKCVQLIICVFFFGDQNILHLKKHFVKHTNLVQKLKFILKNFKINKHLDHFFEKLTNFL